MNKDKIKENELKLGRFIASRVPAFDSIQQAVDVFDYELGKLPKRYRTDMAYWLAGLINTLSKEKIQVELGGENE